MGEGFISSIQHKGVHTLSYLLTSRFFHWIFCWFWRLWEVCFHRWNLETSPSSLPLPSQGRSCWASHHKLPQRLHWGAWDASIRLLRRTQPACQGKKHSHQFKGIHSRLLKVPRNHDGRDVVIHSINYFINSAKITFLGSWIFYLNSFYHLNYLCPRFGVVCVLIL